MGETDAYLFALIDKAVWFTSELSFWKIKSYFQETPQSTTLQVPYDGVYL